MVTEEVRAPYIIEACKCTWMPYNYHITGPKFKGWLLKFRHTHCPVRTVHG